VVLLGDARRDDADHAGVPGLRPEDDPFPGSGIERGEPFLRLQPDPVFQSLAIPILGVERFREQAGLRPVGGLKEVERRLGGVEAARGVQARAEFEADVVGQGLAGDAGHGHERGDAGVNGSFHLLEAFAHQDPVLVDQGDQVGHRPHGHEVEPLTQVQFLDAVPLEEGVAQFEDDAGAAEVVEVIAEFRIDEGHGGRRLPEMTLVMVEHDHVDASIAEGANLFGRRGAAVHRQDQGGRMFGEAALDSLVIETVSVIDPVGEKGVRFQAESPQETVEQGQGGHAIDVVVSVEHHGFLPVDGLEDALHGRLHLRQQEGIGEILEPGMEEFLDLGRGRQAALEEKPHDQRRELEVPGEGTGLLGIGLGAEDPLG